MENDEIARYLAALEREDCYRVEETLKESLHEVTQRVCFVGANGSERGPYVRKLIRRDSGFGGAYERIFEAQRRGRRFKHIPDIIECYQREDLLVVVMEFIEGETLQEKVYRLDPSASLAADVFPPLCDAVSELHESFDPPLIHRDLKPSNVMLSDDGLVLIDFGIAREFKLGAEADTTRFGTRAFAPPEQFGFGQTTVRSDVYALGMLLYFCLTEKIPTQQERDAAFKQQDVPKPLQAVLARATNLDPSERYASAAELKDAFLEAVASPDAEHRSKRPKTAIAIAIAAALALALAIIAVHMSGMREIPAEPLQSETTADQDASQASSASSGERQAETPSSQGAENASLGDMATGAPKRNGFDEASNIAVNIAGVTFQIPNYFGARIDHGDGDTTFYYAESGSSLAMIMTASTYLEDSGDSDEAGDYDMQAAKDSYLTGMTESNAEVFAEVLSSIDCELAGLPARIVTFRGSVQGIPQTTKAVYFIDADAHAIGSLVFGQTDNVQLDCSDDFAKTLASAAPASRQ